MIGAAVGGGLLLCICVAVAVLCVLRAKRKPYAAHVDGDDLDAAKNATQMRQPASSEYGAAPILSEQPLYDQVPPEDHAIEQALRSTPSYTNHGLEQREIVYDTSLPSDSRASTVLARTSRGAGANVAGNRFSVVPKF